MDTQHFREILINTMKTQAATWIVLFVIVLLFLVVDVLYYIKTKSENVFSVWTILPFHKHTKTKLTIKEQIFLKIVALFVLLAVSVWKIIPVYSDIAQQQYICVHAEYSRTTESSEIGGFFSNGFVNVMVDNEQMRLELPSQWTTADFPEGMYTGYVWYSESSKYILAFEPDEDEP